MYLKASRDVDRYEGSSPESAVNICRKHQQVHISGCIRIYPRHLTNNNDINPSFL